MKLRSHPFICAGTRLITSAALAATLIFAPGIASAADKDAHEDRTELRIKDLHTKLKISSKQEEQWSKGAQVMLDDAKKLDTLTQARVDQAKDISAVDDLKSYSEIIEAHADGLKKLIPVFSDLYADMSDAQKKEADILFREGDHANKHKQGHKKSISK